MFLLSATVLSVRTLATVMDVLRTVASHAEFVFAGASCTAQAMNRARTALVDCSLPVHTHTTAATPPCCGVGLCVGQRVRRMLLPDTDDDTTCSLTVAAGAGELCCVCDVVQRGVLLSLCDLDVDRMHIPPAPGAPHVLALDNPAGFVTSLCAHGPVLRNGGRFCSVRLGPAWVSVATHSGTICGETYWQARRQADDDAGQPTMLTVRHAPMLNFFRSLLRVAVTSLTISTVAPDYDLLRFDVHTSTGATLRLMLVATANAA